MDRITDDGILALHISNKYVSLEPVVARIAARSGSRCPALERQRGAGPPGQDGVELGRAGQGRADARHARAAARAAAGGVRHVVPYSVDSSRAMPAWTDDYSDVMRVMMIEEVVNAPAVLRPADASRTTTIE